ncbi:MAG TPA: hypothetical protein HPP77_01785 [Candidatus Hydrogenedentes bacterium]|nr:hypothetical protein [Candidatus Hydrogenedentota bacterium]
MDDARTGREARLGEYNGRPTIFIDGQPTPPMIYHLTGGSAAETWQPIPQKYLRQFSAVGYRLIGSVLWLRRIWLSSGELDMAFAQRHLRGVLDAAPEAAILLRVHVDAPPWWLEQHPDEQVAFTLDPSPSLPPDIRPHFKPPVEASFASEAWKRETGQKLVEFLERLAELPEADALFGLNIAGGNWGEWFYPGFDLEPDAGPAMTRHFRRWLEARYVSDEALQAAWGDPDATLETARVPGVAERFRTAERMFRDPAKERKAIDYYQCHQELVAETPLYFCRLAKETWPRPILVGIFHGYLLHLTHQASGGHLEMGRALESPHVDFLASPYSYEYDARMLGGSGHVRCLAESVRLHGKLWLSEVDHPTLFGDHFGRSQPFYPDTVEGSVAAMRRDVAHTFALGQGMWWYDFGPPGRDGVGGWWDHPALMDETRRLLECGRELMARPFHPCADVLLVFDTRCFYYLGQLHLDIHHPSAHWHRSDTLSFEALNRTVADAYKSGVAFDTIHLDDLDKADLDRYRVVVFAFTPYLSDEHRKFIAERVMCNGRSVVFAYAPGYTDGNTLAPERVAEVVGIQIEKSELGFAPQLLIREGALAPDFPEIRLRVDIQDYWTWSKPLFRVVDPQAEVIGYYAGSREVAFARKRVGDATVWFCGLPLKEPRLLRTIFRASGAHIYNEKNDVLHAGGPVLCIHTETGGKRTITLRNGKRLDLDLEPWTTVILDAVSGEFLMR